MEWLKKINPALVVGLLCGGLGGAVFTWWVSREQPITVGYAISTTSTGMGLSVTSLVPNLSLQIGDESVPAIHAHSIDLTITGGYRESIRVALIVNKKPRVFGKAFTPPSPLHSIQCKSGSGLYMHPVSSE